MLFIQIHEIFVNSILPKIPELIDHREALEESLAIVLNEFRLLLDTLAQSIVSMVSRQCGQALTSIRTIPSLYRMTNREVTTS
jgi:hypothetical protein